MYRFAFFLLFLNSFGPISAQNLPVLYEEDGKFGYNTANGGFLTDPDFEFAQEFSEKGLAFAVLAGRWVALNSRAEQLFHPFVFDNGPDYFSEGLARFTEDNKIGFFDETGQIIIPADFEFAEPFRSGCSVVYKDVEKIQDGDYQQLSGGLRALIDRSGKLLTAYDFTEIGAFSDGKAPAVLTNGKAVFINLQGEILP